MSGENQCSGSSLQPNASTAAKPQAVILLVLCILICGCQSDPFVRAPLPVLKNPDPQSIVNHFPQLLPDQFTSDDTVLLEAPFNIKFSLLGVLQVDRKAGTFELVGLNQMGLQFFHVGGNTNSVFIRDAVPPLMEHKNILLSMAHDIHLVYFGQTPGENYKVEVMPTEVTFSRKNINGTLTYRYGDQPAVLLQKQLGGGIFGATWRVRYYDYRPGDNGKLFPHGIVMDNYQYHYRLIIKNRDWSVADQ